MSTILHQIASFLFEHFLYIAVKTFCEHHINLTRFVPSRIITFFKRIPFHFVASTDEDGNGSGSQRSKRMRTSFKHHQLRAMKTYFALNHNPDAKDLKQLAAKTNLTKRVLQVFSLKNAISSRTTFVSRFGFKMLVQNTVESFTMVAEVLVHFVSLPHWHQWIWIR